MGSWEDVEIGTSPPHPHFLTFPPRQLYRFFHFANRSTFCYHVFPGLWPNPLPWNFTGGYRLS
jgi:hypothetical protein